MQLDSLSNTLSALSDPTRRAILAQLARGEATVSALAKPHAMTFAAVSKHIKVLETAGLVVRGREAQYRPCRLEAAPLAAVSEWLEDYRRFWDHSLDVLGDYLREMQRSASPPLKEARKKRGKHRAKGPR